MHLLSLRLKADIYLNGCTANCKRWYIFRGDDTDKLAEYQDYSSTMIRLRTNMTYRYWRGNFEHDKAGNRGMHLPLKDWSGIDYQVVVKKRLRSTFMVSFSILMACLIGETGRGVDSLNPAPICQSKNKGMEKLNQRDTQIYPTARVREVHSVIPARRARPIRASSVVIATAWAGKNANDDPKCCMPTIASPIACRTPDIMKPTYSWVYDDRREPGWKQRPRAIDLPIEATN